MSPCKQDLYLFFEENESLIHPMWDVINARLVSLYMNRYVIDEENQNEINGIYNLMKVPLEQSWFDWLFSPVKESYDNQIIKNALNDAISSKKQMNTVHFIIGTMFLDGFRSKLNYFFERWLHRKFETYFTQTTNRNGPIVVTLLQGEKQFITGVDLVNYFYFIDDKSSFPSKRRRRINGEGLRNKVSSVQDDLEAEPNLFQNKKELSDFHHVIQHSTLKWPRKIVFDHQKLFSWKMLTDLEEAEFKNGWNPADRIDYQMYSFYECQRFTIIAYPDKEQSMIVDH